MLDCKRKSIIVYVKMKGHLFNIQKFSLHDGPGIRTVVFFKGCLLSCKWCSNPESQQTEPCMMEEAAQKIMDSRQYSIEEVLEICLQDIPFYKESGGGVTLSGGEPLTQPEFTIALLKTLRAENIHTALETCGYAPAEVFNEISALPDLFLFDIKHYNRSRHIEGTGFDNSQILENLKKLTTQKTPVLPRIPVIPKYNDSQDDARGFASLLTELKLDCVQLLPFHQFGERKYELLNKPYSMKNVPQLHNEDLEEYKQIFKNAGINCFF